jgi:hypothetical protein
MNWKNIILIIALAFALVVLDVSFFGVISLGGATIISTLLTVIIFALLNKFDSTLIFATAATLFFTTLSSVPVWIIFFGFFIIPGIVIYLRKTNLPEPSIMISFFYFVIATLVFELTFLVSYKEFNLTGFNLTGSFVLVNSVN